MRIIIYTGSTRATQLYLDNLYDKGIMSHNMWLDAIDNITGRKIKKISFPYSEALYNALKNNKALCEKMTVEDD